MRRRSTVHDRHSRGAERGSRQGREELALPFCKKEGTFIALKGRDYVQEIRNSDKAMEELKASIHSVIDVSNHLPTQHGILIKIVKNDETPEKYPRRSGIPSKRPLGRVR